MIGENLVPAHTSSLQGLHDGGGQLLTSVMAGGTSKVFMMVEDNSVTSMIAEDISRAAMMDGLDQYMTNVWDSSVEDTGNDDMAVAGSVSYTRANATP